MDVADPHPPHPTGHRRFDAVIAIAVVAISLCSLTVAVHTALTEQRMLRASATPILLFETGDATETGPRITFTLGNRGTGPARIVWFELADTDGPLTSIESLVASLQPGQPTSTPKLKLFTQPTSPAILAPRDEIEVLSVDRPTDPAGAKLWDALDRVRFKLTVHACYCSLLDECWITEAAGEIPRPVQSCDPAGHVRLRG